MAGFDGPPTPLLSVLEDLREMKQDLGILFFIGRSIYQRCERVD